MDSKRGLVLYKEKKIGAIGLIFSAIVLSIFLLPAAQQTVKFYIIFAMALLFVGVYVLFFREQYGAKILLGAIAIAVLFYMLGDAENIVDMISKLYYYFITCFPAVLVFWFLTKSSEKQRKIIMMFVMILYLFVLYNTCREILVEENTIHSFENTLEQHAGNIGTYDFVYASGALIPFLGICFTKTTKGWKKSLFGLAIVAQVFFLLNAEYTIALFAAIVTLLLVPILRKKKSRIVYIYVILFIGVFFFLTSILQFVAQRVPSEQMATRIIEVIDLLETGNIEGYNLASRTELYKQAINAFFESPIFGNRILEFDAHSTIFALMARLGVWGIGIYVWMLWKMKKKTEEALNIKEDTWMFTPVFVYLIMMGLMNPIHSALITSAMVWFVIPLGLSLVQGEKKNVTMEN